MLVLALPARQALNEHVGGYTCPLWSLEDMQEIVRRLVCSAGRAQPDTDQIVTPGARRCLARRPALRAPPQGRPCEAAAPAHSIAFRAMTPILATKILPGVGQQPPKYPGPHTDQWDFWS